MPFAGFTLDIKMNMTFGDWVSLMPRPIGPLLAYLTNQTPEPLQTGLPHWSDAFLLGWSEWVMTLHLQCQAWYGSGFFGFITQDSGDDLFVHVHQCGGGILPEPGVRFVYEVEMDEAGEEPRHTSAGL